MSGRSGPTVAAFAIVIAIVSAMTLDSGILANTPYGSTRLASNAVVGPRTDGRSDTAADALGLGDGLLRDLLSGSLTDPAPWYPPFGITPPSDVPAGTGPTAAPSAPASSGTTPAARTPTRPTTTVVPVGAWKIAPIVTWYGPGFYGHRTACGQRYTRRIVGVASRTLPCGTLVQFRWHGITRIAPVIDRGPYATAAYVFDFSAQLSCDLFREPGTTNACFTRYNVQWRIVGKGK